MRAAQRKHADAPVIPDKLYFRIGDVAELCGVETYVLRFWETEFPQLKPGKSGTGQRLYRKREVEYALRLKELLHNQGYTIAGARLALKSEAKSVPQTEMPFARGRAERAKLDKARSEARELLAILSTDIGGGKPPAPAPSRKKSSAPHNNVHAFRGPELFS
jgi:DNA-binding transcriptional MerR regulator